MHDDKAIECLNKIFFGQTNREPRHGSVYRAAEYLHTCRPEPEVTTDKRNRKKCYLDILAAVFRTEKAAVNHPRGLCISSPVHDVPCRRKTSSVPFSSGFFNPLSSCKQQYKTENRSRESKAPVYKIRFYFESEAVDSIYLRMRFLRV